VRTPDAARAAPAWAGGDPQTDQLGGKISPQFTPDQRNPQVRHLTLARDYAAGRMYRVQPARPDDGAWAGPDTFTYYVEIRRLADGKRLFTWRGKEWQDADSWAHARWVNWMRLGWRPELSR
jgi:hypothetical protein